MHLLMLHEAYKQCLDVLWRL